jgi:AcrR family transcriptional regulator
MPAPGHNAKSRGGKRERNKAENRHEILEAARRVFADLGFEAATVRDVIGATKLAAGTFYNYFPDKESVLRTLLDETLGEMQERAKAARHDAATVEDIVRGTFAVSFGMLDDDPQVFDLLRRNADAIRVILNEPGFVANRDELARDLEAAIQRSGGPAIDADYLTAAISGLAFEVAAVAVERPRPDLAAAADFATSLVLGGLSALKPARKPAPRTAAKAAPKATPKTAKQAAAGTATARKTSNASRRSATPRTAAATAAKGRKK